MYKPTQSPNLCLFCAFTQRPWRALGPDGLQRAAFTYSAHLSSPRSLGRLANEDERESDTGRRRSLVRYHKFITPGLRTSEFEKNHGHKRVELAKRMNFSNRKLKRMIICQLDIMEAELRASPLVEGFGLSEDQINAAFTNYRSYLYDSISQDLETKKGDNIWRSLIDAYLDRGEPALRDQLRFGFYGHVVRSRFSPSDLRNQKEVADLRYPFEWFPSTRQLTRTIHLHVGPTNSGKTYQALKRLEEADTGCYAGPLRLLAHEVYTRMNAKGKPCWLVTGEERRLPLNKVDGVPSLISCTVEMTPLNVGMEVAIIDEIQMLGDEERGWAWTEALVGVRAKELHLCGEERAVPLVKDLAAAMGDKLEIHRYKRLSPLEMEIQSLNGKLDRLRKGDCVVSFSVMGIHALRKQIEGKTGKKCAVVYGSLPPETRAQQARLFNEPNNDYDFLVASDAIGMGLNLSIKRVIFETIRKHDGANVRQLSVSNIKQIAGRAGRYRSAFQDTKSTQTPAVLDGVLDPVPSDPLTPNPLALGSTPISAPKSPASSESLSSIPLALGSPSPIPIISNPPNEQKSICPAPLVSPLDSRNKNTSNVGYVTTLEKADLPIVTRAMASTPPPLRTAGILPTDFIIKRFAKYFPPGTPFSYVLIRLNEIAQVSNRFHICDLKDKLILADAIHHVKNLTIEDRLLLCLVPVNVSKEGHVQDYLVDLATAVSEQKGGGLLELPHLGLEVLDEPVTGNRSYLKRVEDLHKMIVAYLWLSFRFPGVFTTRPLAMHVKEIVEDAIAKSLSMFNFSEATGKKMRRLDREKELFDLLHRNILDQEQFRINQAKRSTELGLREASEETLEKAKIAADELNEEEGLDDEDFKETEETLADGRTFKVESQPEWDDEDEWPQEDDDLDKMANLTTGNNLETSSPQNKVALGSVTFDRPAEDLEPFDIDTERSDQASVHDAGPLYNRNTSSVESVDEQQHHSASVAVFPSAQPASEEELARLIAQQQQRREQDARA